LKSTSASHVRDFLTSYIGNSKLTRALHIVKGAEYV
jgi:hypothetical protein